MTEAKASPIVVLRVRDFRLYWSGLVAQIGRDLSAWTAD